MTEPRPIIHKVNDGICTISLNRPEVHNAFDNKLISELTTVLQAVTKKDDVRIVVLQAIGKNFSAGADLNWMKEMSDFSLQENEADALKLSELLELLNNISKPTIALVQGHTIGGGIGLLTCCDIVMATENAQFCFAEVKLGLVPATIAPYVIQKIGNSATRRYFITAEPFDVNEAKQIGLVHHIVPTTQLQQASSNLITAIIQNGPVAIAKSKHLINKLTPIDKTIKIKTAKFLAEVRSSSEGKEGVRAFLKKRQPSWLKTTDH